MKRIILLILPFILFSAASFGDTITLSQAVKLKMISVAISGAPIDENTNSYTPSYTGECIQISVENLTDKDIKVFLEAGQFMNPTDTATQRMIITREQMIAVQKKQTKISKAFAMCSQLMNHAPKTDTKFNLGKKAEGKLLELAQLISKNNFQSNAAQSAIWAMTDNDNIYNIYSDNKEETKILRSFVKEAKGLTNVDVEGNAPFKLDEEAEGTYVKYAKGKLDGSFEFELKKDTPLNLTLYNEEGTAIRKTLQNYTFKAGQNTLTYEFTYNNIPVGNYRLKLYDDKGTIFLDKILTFK
jgi:hypothetical protein